MSEPEATDIDTSEVTAAYENLDNVDEVRFELDFFNTKVAKEHRL
jgi:hypothetical protein